MGNAELQRRMVEHQAITGLELGHHELSDNGMQSLDVREDGVDFNILEMDSGRTPEGDRAFGPHITASAGNLDADGGHQYGVRLAGGLGGVRINEQAETGVDLDTPNGAIEASVGDQGATLGADGTLLEVAGRARLESLGDTRAEYGLGASAGFGGRLHWADTDDDGDRELGFGISAGIGRIDITNDWLGSLLPDWL